MKSTIFYLGLTFFSLSTLVSAFDRPERVERLPINSPYSSDIRKTRPSGEEPNFKFARALGSFHVDSTLTLLEECAHSKAKFVCTPHSLFEAITEDIYPDTKLNEIPIIANPISGSFNGINVTYKNKEKINREVVIKILSVNASARPVKLSEKTFKTYTKENYILKNIFIAPGYDKCEQEYKVNINNINYTFTDGYREYTGYIFHPDKTIESLKAGGMDLRKMQDMFQLMVSIRVKNDFSPHLTDSFFLEFKDGSHLRNYSDVRVVFQST